PAVHAAQDQIGKKLISPAATVALLAGAYLATDREYWDRPWVSVPLVLLIVIMGLGGAVMSPGERRASALAQRDVEASGQGPVQLSDGCRAVAERLAAFGAASAFLVLVALFFMLAKPGGY